ncbi:MAG: hypothetical protein JNL70_15385 [Saprospiraceae bacterium]|nr:hypothetical protein [Saprospiraceae bacterium]
MAIAVHLQRFLKLGYSLAHLIPLLAKNVSTYLSDAQPISQFFINTSAKVQ